MAEETKEKQTEEKKQNKFLSDEQLKFQQKAKTEYFNGVGRRKRAVAQVRLAKGKGNFFVNGKTFATFFSDIKNAEKFVLYPLELTGNLGKFDISVIVKGGGRFAERDAIRLGISKALVKYNEDLRITLKKSDLLTRDPREKERKKYGLKKARRAPQWAKR